ncbi:MAG TPA: ankyrin repeat domain-containing protein, partial [Phycisphaerae bacterium]|nr:ankyrin repeat domain-containing protein [Phycisphaerae bacterium]
VKLLVESKCDLAAGERRGNTALHLAARRGRKDVVTILLAAGSDVSAGDREGATPLHAAASRGRLEMVKLLLSKGADVKAATTRSKATALHRLAGGAFSTRDGQTEPGQDFIATGKLLIAKGAEVDARDGSGRTPLLAAAGLIDYWRGKAPLRAPLVQLFIDAGADVNARDERGRTPLHHAAERTDPAVVKMLLDAGADPFAESRRSAFGGELSLDGIHTAKPEGKEVASLLRTAMAPRIAAEEKAVTETLLRFLDAVWKDQPEKWKQTSMENPHYVKGRWQSLAQTIRKDYVGVPGLLQTVIGVKTRCGWATAMIERPPGGKEPYMLFTLLQLPDGTWRVLNARSALREPVRALDAELRNDRMTYREVRNAIFDAAGKTEGLKVWGRTSGGLPRAGKLSVTVKDGRLRMEVSDARPDRVWAVEVHEKLIKKWTGGELILVRRVEAIADGVKLQAENGKAIWRGADKEYIIHARDGKVHVEVKDGQKTETLTGESFTVEWPGGLRLTPKAKPPATGPADRTM